MELIRQLDSTESLEEFEALVQRGHPSGLVARLLTQDVPAALGDRPDAAPFALDLLDSVLAAAASGRFSKEGIPAVLAALVAGAQSVDAAVDRAGFSTPPGEDLDSIVDRVVRANALLVQERGEAALSPLMGDVMREVRGKRDGREVAESLRRAIARLRSGDPASSP